MLDHKTSFGFIVALQRIVLSLENTVYRIVI